MSDDNIRKELIDIYEKIGIPTKLKLNKDKVLSLIKHDKKSIGAEIDCVVVDEVGSFKFKKMSLSDIENRMEYISM